MRQRVVRVAVAAVLVALVLLAVPLAAGIQRSFFDDERGELERIALAAAVGVGPQFAVGDGVELPDQESGGQLGVYDLTMRLRAGTGTPQADDVTRRAARGTVVRGHTGGKLVVAVPVSSSEKVIGVVRATATTSEVWKRVLLAWLGLLGAVLLALGAAIAVARHQARALSTPLEALSATAQAVADGDLTARAEHCGIAEIDQLVTTQNTMVERLTRLLQHERHFSANASHQLRTPLAGLQLGLEAALNAPREPGSSLRPALEEALEASRHLQRTIDEVLRLARADSGGPVSTPDETAADLLERAARRWHGAFADAGRRLDIDVRPEARSLRLPGRATDQILDVLLDNALRHGRGTATVTVREATGAIAVDVTDEGALRIAPQTAFERGATTGSGNGIGLSFARELAEAAGGRLTASGTDPTAFTLLLPDTDRTPNGER
ncbi:HAMP domain-containing sensor histidine kinase [Streptomyces sp. H10-C2]|uniref:HAMP domain-containing sensor histidine kinase n=1 Tax=unclassified Streptomyces TaxID=2593676 RepID=UPI0024BA4B2C|nr:MULTISPECIES: HAMP domain-containing sensor histidine kinase [unclassified Streptomyces]MDJ0343924.1 HAMP domain-containing sensor histidine kinase [Streptomyces sp. PH10-H1]MDJ0373365.1 HAMP domain-containing sensor histidine kinase [Streptomyces sp. H10-C2]